MFENKKAGTEAGSVAGQVKGIDVNKLSFTPAELQAASGFAKVAEDFRNGKVSSSRLETEFIDNVIDSLDGWPGTRQQKRKHFSKCLKQLGGIAHLVGGCNGHR